MKPTAVKAACAIVWLAVACSKGPAEESFKAAEQALADAPEIASDLPEESAAIAKVLAEARASFDAGRYTDALRASLPLPDRIAAAKVEAERRRQERAAAWDALSRDVPARLEALAARLALLVSGGWISSERQTAAQAEIVGLRQAWADAKSLFQAGEITKAVAAAEDVTARAGKLAGALGLKFAPTPPAPAAGASPSPAPPAPKPPVVSP